MPNSKLCRVFPVIDSETGLHSVPDGAADPAASNLSIHHKTENSITRNNLTRDFGFFFSNVENNISLWDMVRTIFSCQVVWFFSGSGLLLRTFHQCQASCLFFTIFTFRFDLYMMRGFTGFYDKLKTTFSVAHEFVIVLFTLWFLYHR